LEFLHGFGHNTSFLVTKNKNVTPSIDIKYTETLQRTTQPR